MIQKELTCIICPRGCTITVDLDENGKVLQIAGNGCPRGAVYAENEFTNPQRTLTTTLRCEDGTMVAVKTDKTIPKDKMFEAMNIINGTIVKLPVKIGDVLVEDVFGSNIVATQNHD